MAGMRDAIERAAFQEFKKAFEEQQAAGDLAPIDDGAKQ